MICWYCFWGWAKPVAQIYREALSRCGGDDSGLQFGASHIVWGDENFTNDAIEYCLRQLREVPDQEYAETIRWSLEKLMQIPEPERDIEPDNYDGCNPYNYPPSVEVERI